MFLYIKKFKYYVNLSNKPAFINQYFITWMLHQIFMYFNKMKIAAGYKNATPLPLTPPLPSYWMNELTMLAT